MKHLSKRKYVKEIKFKNIKEISFLAIKEIELIIWFIEDDILNSYNIIKGGQYICNLNQCEKESIYIFYNEEEKILIIKQKYYQIINAKLVNIKKWNINQKKKFQSKNINKIKQKKNVKRKLNMNNNIYF